MNPNIDLSKPDLNIVKSLKEIKWPLKNKNGVLIYISKERIEHVSVKRHFLKIRDIKIIKEMLLNPLKTIDKDLRKKKVYYGKRKGTSGNDSHPFLEIVTINKKGIEYIWTIYPRRNMNEKIPH